jgi:ABC-type lipoprotein release transport system permease subunit
VVAAWYRARAQLRGSWRAIVALALLVGLAGGVVLATVAGARRSASAEGRYRDASDVAHATFFHPDPDPALVRRVAALPQVEAFGPIAYFALAPLADGAPLEETVGVLGVVATLTFGASLAKLIDDPELFGWNWDVSLPGIEGVPTADVIDSLEPELSGVADVEGAAALRLSTADLEGKETQLLGFDGLQGSSIGPTLLEGRPAATSMEVVLGSETMQRLEVDIGDQIDAAGVDGSVELVVVGRGVFAADTNEVADGAALTMDGLQALDAYVGTTDILIDWSPGADREAGLRRLTEIGDRHRNVVGGDPMTSVQPLPVHNLARVDAVPRILGAFLALLAAVAVAHALITSVRRRQRDMAVLRAVGFVRRQVSAAVAWQSATMVLVGVVVGAPLGVAVGRLTWSAVARVLGVVDAPAMPLLDVGTALLVAFLVALGLSVVPAHRARRDRPAVALRSE